MKPEEFEISKLSDTIMSREDTMRLINSQLKSIQDGDTICLFFTIVSEKTNQIRTTTINTSRLEHIPQICLKTSTRVRELLDDYVKIINKERK